jgi:hypothetical protein
MDKLEDQLEAKLSEVRKQGEAKLIDLIRQDSNLTKVLRDIIDANSTHA